MRKWPHHVDNSTCNRASPHGIHGSLGCHSHTHFRLSMVRVIILNHSYFDCCRWEYIKMQSGEDFLWESFPRALQSSEGAGRYINTFQAPFQELPPLSSQEVYTLQACSLLVIPPPPPGRVAPQGGFPADLVEINLWDWASLVQDVAAGLQVLPPRLSKSLGPRSCKQLKPPPIMQTA